jgi:O-antigen biosynthesis protein
MAKRGQPDSSKMALDGVIALPRRVLRRRNLDVAALADRARDAREWGLAAELYRETLERNPDNPPIWVQYGHALKEFGELRDREKLVQAERAYRRALALDPRVADTYLQLGHVLKLQGKIEEAGAAYLRAFALDPSMSNSIQELGGLGWSESYLAELRRLVVADAHGTTVGAREAFSQGPAQTGKSEPPVGAPYASYERDLEDDIRLIRESGLFDEAYYRARNPDLPTNIDPIRHFLQWGAGEGRDPHPLFVTNYYLRGNREITQAFAAGLTNPLVHFLEHGGFEGRNPHPLFHASFYMRRYADVRHSGLNPATHYVLRGAREQRICNPAGHSPFDNYGLLPGESPDLAGIREIFPLSPLISVVMPVYATKSQHERALAEALRSVEAQTYENWELCICNDASTFQPAVSILDDYRSHGARIRIVTLEANRGISAATNAALDVAKGEFVAFMDHDDLLAPNALYEVVKAINRCPIVDVVYTDQDKIDLDGHRTEPFYKPAWSPEMFRGVMYVGHLLVVRRSLLSQIGGCEPWFDKVQDYELMLRLSEATTRILHIPKILYHWRMLPESVALGSNEKSGIENLQAAAVTTHLRRLGVRAKAIINESLPHRVKIVPEGLRRRPKVSIVIPTKDAPDYIARCLETIFASTSYDNYEVVVVDTGTRDQRALETFRSYPILKCSFDKPFNFSRANNFGVSQSSGEYLIFLNNDTEVITSDWIENMLFYFLEYDDVGIVAPLLLYPDGRVQHAGVILGPRGTADHVMRVFPADADGYAGSLSCAREVTAATAACLMMPRRLFDEIDGFTEEFVTHYQDVDLCLKVRKKELRILFTPFSRLIHYESVSRGDFYDHLDRDLILDVWGEVIEKGDPYYNINFDRDHVDYTVYKTVPTA